MVKPDWTRKEIFALIDRIANGIMDRGNAGVFTPDNAGRHYMDNWDWYQGVALFGLYRTWRETGSGRLLAYIEEWFEKRIGEGLPGKNVNSMCPLLTLTYLYELRGRERDMKLCEEWAEYAMKKLPRTVEGGFQHVTVDSENYMQLWDDTLYMTVLFIARMGELTGRDEYVQESIRQFLVHLKYLTDPETGLFYHAFNFDGMHHFAGALWGRGNAWYTAGLADYLDMAELPGGVKLFLISSLKRQADALKTWQDKEGMWHTLINDPEGSYAEASATAGFAYGIMKAVRTGILDGSYSEMCIKAVHALISRVDENGILQDVSAGTAVKPTLDGYRQVKKCAQPYGQSMMLLALTEAARIAAE